MGVRCFFSIKAVDTCGDKNYYQTSLKLWNQAFPGLYQQQQVPSPQQQQKEKQIQNHILPLLFFPNCNQMYLLKSNSRDNPLLDFVAVKLDWYSFQGTKSLHLENQKKVEITTGKIPVRLKHAFVVHKCWIVFTSFVQDNLAVFLKITADTDLFIMSRWRWAMLTAPSWCRKRYRSHDWKSSQKIE